MKKSFKEEMSENFIVGSLVSFFIGCLCMFVGDEPGAGLLFWLAALGLGWIGAKLRPKWRYAGTVHRFEQR